MKKRRITQDDAPGGLTHNPFEALRRSESDDVGEESPSPTADPESEEAEGAEQHAGLVVRREKKGRGGKTVTRVSGLTLEPSALSELAREMKRALGCGATVEEADVLLQGALTERAAEWLRKRLGARVTIGN